MKKILTSRVSFLTLGLLIGAGATYLVQGLIAPAQQSQTVAMTAVQPGEQIPTSMLKPQQQQTQSRHDPFDAMKQMQAHMQQMFNRFGQDPFASMDAIDDNFGGTQLGNDVKISQHEDDDYKYVDISADGLDQEKLNVAVKDGMIQVSGEISQEDNNQGSTLKSTSSYHSSFSQSFNVPNGVAADQAQFLKSDHGVTIKFPKHA